MNECGRSAGSGTFSLSATAETTTTGGSRRPPSEQRVERGDAQADEVRRRREVRLVGDAAARVEAHGPRGEPGAQVGGEVAGLAVVAGDDEHRAAVGGRVGERARATYGAQRGGDERAAAVARERGAVGVVGELGEEGTKRQFGQHERPLRGARAGVRSL